MSTTAIVGSPEPENGDIVITLTVTQTYTGSLDGTCSGVITLVLHPDLTFNSESTCTFTGTVTGGSGPGIATFHFEGSGSLSSFTLAATIDDGLGGLENISGGFSAVFVSGPTSFSYSGFVSFGS